MRFSRKRFKQTLFNIHSLPFEEQKQQLENTLNQWKQNNNQLDDIIIFGFRVADAYGEVDLFLSKSLCKKKKTES